MTKPTPQEQAHNERLAAAALPTMKANGAFLLAEQGFENPTAAERRAAELIAMNLASKHPLFIGMMMGCTVHEIVVLGETAVKSGAKEGDQRSVRDVPGFLRTMIEQVAKAL